ncbi:MAG: hypothetical protein AB7C89_02140 [Intestinibacillus sp.]
MSTSAIDRRADRRHFRKTVFVYLALAFAAVAVNLIYGAFGHGVHAAAMTFMFLYPLVGGALVFLLCGLRFPALRRVRGYRLCYNAYHSGIATLTVSSFLHGILEIAGTSSPFTAGLYAFGAVCIVFALLVLFSQLPRRRHP